jgi:hypothetical protein
MVPNQKRSGFTRSRECNAHPMTMPKTPDGMPTIRPDFLFPAFDRQGQVQRAFQEGKIVTL